MVHRIESDSAGEGRAERVRHRTRNRVIPRSNPGSSSNLLSLSGLLVQCLSFEWDEKQVKLMCYGFAHVKELTAKRKQLSSQNVVEILPTLGVK